MNANNEVELMKLERPGSDAARTRVWLTQQTKAEAKLKAMMLQHKTKQTLIVT